MKAAYRRAYRQQKDEKTPKILMAAQGHHTLVSPECTSLFRSQNVHVGCTQIKESSAKVD